MKNSIGIKLFIGITLFSIIIVSFSWVLNTKFLEDYYFKKKQENLFKYAEAIQTMYSNNVNDIDFTLKSIEDSIGGNITILNENGIEIYGSMFMSHRGGKGKGNPKAMSLLTKKGLNKVLSGETILEYYIHPRFNTMSLVLAAPLINGNILIMESPVSSIKESVEVAKDFHIYIGIISLLAGTFLAFIFSKIFTKPIIELNKVAKSMAKLDFSKKYRVKNDDEINQLGKTINYLSDKLDTSISELNRANKRLMDDIEKERELEKSRKEFVSNVSHELKTPISLIQGYAEGLRDSVIEDEESKNFYCDVIIDEAKKMDKLVKDLLNLSQLEAGYYQLQKESFNIYKLSQKIIDKYLPILKERNITLQINCDNKKLKVYADIIRIEQVIVNLINNAINHVDDKKTIKINIRDYIEKVKIEIINTGKAIPEEEMDKIWDSFYKIDKSRARKYGGTGLGLSIVKSILNLHNNSFGVSNIDDEVMFWFEMDKWV
ncbi:sensor histidine kinase [Paramaledivibacter caminithermalis]|jgi:signal transduction histidine kinase|uniref:histidine kinase n=1 Tax=Paramaledivibacter caminithermalis (strain DSM 15212 / CIP 107654 / DViRD3) TaxID=1121301 RepID=A0A1M6KK57_PARC5|nr:HAMP domain-containing sensor histidine kinase [Paramaledivibacter caminithermalis]SHJ59358.1 HAMP domain-containing protein [Paramaledivibacter caminithermalis DSM 15212]